MTSSAQRRVVRVDGSGFSWDGPAEPSEPAAPSEPSEPAAPSGPAGCSGGAEGIRRVVAAAAAADGREPLNEQTLLSLRHAGLSSAGLWAALEDGDLVGFALVDPSPEQREDASGRPSAPVAANLVVDPSHRGRGIGRALAESVLTAFPDARMSIWSHGNHPAAAALARTTGFERSRDLWIMRRSLTDDLPPLVPPRHGVVRTFDPDRDRQAFLDVNAAAFVDHPEQGGLTLADLDERIGEPWFDPAGFFLAEAAGDLLGFHWTKVHREEPAYGEVYVVGVAPEAQGSGLGRVLTLTGLHHLRSLNLAEVILYVESDNSPAVAVYERLGFGHADRDTDVMYTR